MWSYYIKQIKMSFKCIYSYTTVPEHISICHDAVLLLGNLEYQG